jgi:hypothetical protein
LWDGTRSLHRLSFAHKRLKKSLLQADKEQRAAAEAHPPSPHVDPMWAHLS